MTSEPSDRSWPGLLEALLGGQDLSAGDTAWAMDQVMSGTAGAARLGGLLVALRAKGEVAEDIEGLVEAMLGHALPLTVAGLTLDIVGTGGDGAHSVNISTMSAVVAAGAGARVVKHGNRSASSPCGSADVLEELGVELTLSPQDVAEVAEEVGMTFCFAPAFHPAMRHAAATRRELGVRTVFNVLGPLAIRPRPRPRRSAWQTSGSRRCSRGCSGGAGRTGSSSVAMTAWTSCRSPLPPRSGRCRPVGYRSKPSTHATWASPWPPRTPCAAGTGRSAVVGRRRTHRPGAPGRQTRHGWTPKGHITQR